MKVDDRIEAQHPKYFTGIKKGKIVHIDPDNGYFLIKFDEDIDSYDYDTFSDYASDKADLLYLREEHLTLEKEEDAE